MRGILEPDHLILILLVVLVLFGGKKIPELASGLGKGIREFKSGMSGSDPAPPPPAPLPATRVVNNEAVTPGAPVTETTVITPEPKRLIS